MIYKYNDLLGKYKNRYQITKAIKNNEIYKIAAGFYSDRKYPSEMEFIQKNTLMRYIQWEQPFICMVLQM